MRDVKEIQPSRIFSSPFYLSDKSRLARDVLEMSVGCDLYNPPTIMRVVFSQEQIKYIVNLTSTCQMYIHPSRIVKYYFHKTFWKQNDFETDHVCLHYHYHLAEWWREKTNCYKVLNFVVFCSRLVYITYSQSSVVEWLGRWANLGVITTIELLGGRGFESHNWHE